MEKNIWAMIAAAVEAIANMGAGAASTVTGYEPQLPESLYK